MPSIKLQSSDGEIFETDIAVAKSSGIIKNMLEGCRNEDDEVVPLAVTSHILGKVLTWAEYHKDDPEPTVFDDSKDLLTDDIDSWDSNFLEENKEILFNLIVAANYLEVKGLLKVACQTVANMVKGKSPQEIRQTFNIVLDDSNTEEEEEAK